MPARYGVLDAPSTNPLVTSLFGNNYNTVDLTDNAIINLGSIHESTASTASTYSVTTNTTTLYTISSDAIGNITNIGNVTMDWNGRRLESISQNGTEVVTYDYNIDGQRIKKTAPDLATGEPVTTEYFYNGSILAGQKKGNDVLIFMYDNNGDIFGFTYNGAEYYYIKNAQKDVTAIVDTRGHILVRYYYDSWGQIIGSQDSTSYKIGTINPITYRSYYYDVELNMYYLNSRYYLPDMCRFLNADTTDIVEVQADLNDKNLFSYCDNNPTGRVDSNGYFWETVLDVASLCLSIADVAANPDDAWAWIGLAADFIDLVPFVTGVGEVTRAVKLSKNMIESVDTATDAAKVVKKTTSKGWKVGDDITTLTKAGNAPSWSTVRSRYWKNEAYYNPNLYSSSNLNRMSKGKAPKISYVNGNTYSMELHHIQPRHLGGGNEYSNLLIVTPWEHAAIDKYRYFNP